MPSKAYIGRSSKEPKGSARQVRSVSRTIATWAHNILSFAVSPTPQGVAVAGGGLGGGIASLNLPKKYACDGNKPAPIGLRANSHHSEGTRPTDSRGGKEGVSTCRSRRYPYYKKKKHQ